MHTLLFVYGTLKTGQRLHDRWLGEGSGATLCNKGYIEGFELYVHPEFDLPMIIYGMKGKVYGEVYVVPEELRTELDVLEGGYSRETVEFISTEDRGSGTTLRVEVYIWLNNILIGSKFQESGTYLGRVTKA